MAPSTARQSASPTRSQLSRPVAPSISVTHPASAWPVAELAKPNAVNAMTSSPVVTDDHRFIAPSFLGCPSSSVPRFYDHSMTSDRDRKQNAPPGRTRPEKASEVLGCATTPAE